MEGRFIRLIDNPNTLSLKAKRLMEGGFIRLTDNPNILSLKAGSLVGIKCNRALVFMSTRALCPSISSGL